MYGLKGSLLQALFLARCGISVDVSLRSNLELDRRVTQVVNDSAELLAARIAVLGLQASVGYRIISPDLKWAWLPWDTTLTSEELISRLASIPKPVRCEAKRLVDQIAVDCATITDSVKLAFHQRIHARVVQRFLTLFEPNRVSHPAPKDSMVLVVVGKDRSPDASSVFPLRGVKSFHLEYDIVSLGFAFDYPNGSEVSRDVAGVMELRQITQPGSDSLEQADSS